jgi:hypothetical protein
VLPGEYSIPGAPEGFLTGNYHPFQLTIPNKEKKERAVNLLQQAKCVLALATTQIFEPRVGVGKASANRSCDKKVPQPRRPHQQDSELYRRIEPLRREYSQTGLELPQSTHSGVLIKSRSCGPWPIHGW